jgi:hypothetical protein
MLVAIAYGQAKSDEWMDPACNGPEQFLAIVVGIAVEGAYEKGAGGF